MISGSFGKNPDRQYMGLKDYGSYDVWCKNCDKLLLEIKITKTNNDLLKEQKTPIFTNVCVKCNLCKNFETQLELEGQFYPGVGNDNLILNVDLLDNQDVIMTVEEKHG